MLEAFNQPTRITRSIDRFLVDIAVDPLSSYPSGEKTALVEEIIPLVNRELNGGGFTIDDLKACIFGDLQRGKILATLRDLDHKKLEGFVSGQLLNDGVNPVDFQNYRIFHVSMIFSSNKSLLSIWNLFIQELINSSSYKPDFFSCFTQSPRIYSLLRYVTNAKIYPSHVNRGRDVGLETVYSQLISFLNFDRCAHQGVFQSKVKGSFTAEKQYSNNMYVNEWFYGSLGIVPERGDLLLLLGRINPD